MGGRPPTRPLALADARPFLVRSLKRLASSSAKALIIVKNILPKGKSNASHKPEPDPQVNQFYKDAVKSIRHSGDKHIIFLEGIWDPDNLKKPSYYKDTAHNLVYEYHNYPTEANDSVKQSFDEKFKKFKKKIITFLVIWVNSIQDQWEKNLKHKMAI